MEYEGEVQPVGSTTHNDWSTMEPQPTGRSKGWSGYDTDKFKDYIQGDYSDRILIEQCDTIEVMLGDYTHGCTELC